MIKKSVLILAGLFCLLTTWFWYDSGAWAYGEMPTKGVYKTVGFTVLAFLCFWLAGKFKRKSV